MRNWFAGHRLAVLATLVVSITVGLALAQKPPADEPPPSPRLLPADLTPTGFVPPADARPANASTLPKRSPLGQQIHLVAKRGAEWLYRAHQPTGRFLTGWRPTLAQAADDDPFP